MKKIISLLAVLLCLCACTDNKKEIANQEKYLDYCKLLNEQETFKDKSEYFDISTDITKIDDDSYRFYVVIDNTKISMYDVEAIAYEKDSDYTSNMAANIGIFEENKYNLIPNQVNLENGFVKGFSISGVSNNSNPEILLLVSWSDVSYNSSTKEYIHLTINSSENYE